MTSLPVFQPLPTRPGDIKRWGNVKASVGSLAMIEAAKAHEGLTVVIAPSSQAALQAELDAVFFNDAGLEVLLFPDWETLPYDVFSPHEAIISQRLATLARLPQLHKGVLIIPLTTLLHRLPPTNYLAAHSLHLDIGQTFQIEAMRQRLQETGYRCVNTVEEHGDFAVRGAIFDIFPMGSPLPYRIELFDDEIDTLRTFDPETQRSLDKVDSVRLLPAREFPLDAAGIRHFREQFKEQFDADTRHCALFQDVSGGIASAGIEYYLPLFFSQMATLFDYLPENTLVIHRETLNANANTFLAEASHRYDELGHDLRRPILPPNKIFLPLEELNQRLGDFRRLTLHSGPEEDKPGRTNLPCHTPPDLAIHSKAQQPLSKLEAHLLQCKADKRQVLFCVETAGRKETLLELLQRIRIQPRSVETWDDFLTQSDATSITIAPLSEGMELDSPLISIITEPQLFGEHVMQVRRRKRSDDGSGDQIIKNLTELKIGAPVVHIEHGVGRYHGLQTLTIDGQAQEFLTLEYAGGSKLYVPVASLQLISRYSGAEDSSAPLHRLGTEQWAKEKRKAQEQVHDVAAELLNIYARRAAKAGYAFKLGKADYQAFVDGFRFEETPDQESAIQAVMADMTSPRPMDRLVCGDVGFGKTEVAMRAAFIAVQSGKQVAILVPTTLLAQQHYETLKDRFSNTPVNIEVLSRFRTSKEQTRALALLEEGRIDIVVGTHKLLQENIRFKDLGLIIVDEEHRFGVRHKEKLKAIRADVDMLTLTATPIPRTLNMALSSIRDLSIIATPPAKRLSIKTFVREARDSLIKEAILRELLRGGQVYYLHNEVSTIEKTAQHIESLVPEARVAIAHGQMRERELERVMTDFYHKRFNVLVCTTIIETGIDVPSANTIVMDRADKLGLAQLHQLRGRVGRSHHQAYAYLLTPNAKALSDDAHKRLEAITLAHDLGAGFTLASHDLEIRGAGELLGDEQSGHMHAIGFSLYMEMLNRAVKAIKQGKTPNLDQPLDLDAEVNLRIPALLPSDYLADVHARLILYKRISAAEDDAALDELRVEMIDRFGPLPDGAKNLFAITRLQKLASGLGITKIDAGPKGGRLEFGPHPKVDPLTLVKLVQSMPQKFKLEGADKLRFMLESETAQERIELVRELLARISPKASALKQAGT
ncbi:Transcription repair coupling factor [gamma proteobacterium HdN1]|nr:Transcription repair coupling factor [gamma proteobacterium HdN1]